MSALARGVFEDLRRRRLLPVAALLVIALVAIPLFMRKSSEPVPATPAAATTTAAVPGGLPSPNQVLGSEKPLVTLAVLDQPSDLGEFDSKNPFKPIDQVDSGGASEGESPASPVEELTSGDAPASGGDGGGGSGGGGGGGVSPPGGGDGGGQPPTGPGTNDPKPPNTPSRPKTERKLTYAVDLAIRGPKGVRRYRGVPKLSLLPSQDNPLLVFLGVEDAGTKAVFLVDAKLRSLEGEGTCTPTPEQCATLALAPGELHTLINDAGQRWTIQIGEVRETSVAKAAASARAAQKRRERKATTSVGNRPRPRFIPPMITDLFTGGRS